MLWRAAIILTSPHELSVSTRGLSKVYNQSSQHQAGIALQQRTLARMSAGGTARRLQMAGASPRIVAESGRIATQKGAAN